MRELADRAAKQVFLKEANSMRRLFGLILSLTLVACGGTVRELSEHKVGQEPPLGSVQSAVVGDVLYSEYEYTGNIGAITSAAFEPSAGLGSVKVSNGTSMTKSDIDGRSGYCTTAFTYIDPIAGPWSSTCWFDTNNDGKFEEFWFKPGSVFFSSDADVPLPYRATEISTTGGGFKNEIIYQGLDSDVIRLLYREYIDNMARPAFQQDLTYNKSTIGPTEIRFRRVSIEVIDALGSEITYSVKSGF